MSRVISAAAFAVLLGSASAVYSQVPSQLQHETFPKGTIEGIVLDETHAPIVGAMVSVVGRETSAASTDRTGHFAIKSVPYGPYSLTVHARGYWQGRGRTVQLNIPRVTVATIQLSRANGDKAIPAPTASVVPVSTQLAGFGEISSTAAAQPAPTTAVATEQDSSHDGDQDGTETAWRLRHLPRSILKDAAVNAAWLPDRSTDSTPVDWFARAVTVGPAALFSNLSLSGQINLLTTESFDRTGQLMNPAGGRGVAFVSVGTQAAGGAWAMQGAMTEGDIASWIVAGSYKSFGSASHAYDLGLSYSTQQYDGGNPAALAAMRDGTRNAGTVYGFDQWTVSPRLIVGYGTAFARYDYLPGSDLWSPQISVTIPLDSVRIKAVATRHAVAPGAEEFAPSGTGVWLPPERTFSPISVDNRFTPEETRQVDVSLEKDLAAGLSVSLRGFTQQVEDQLAEIFGAEMPGVPGRSLGHYLVANAGDIDARGWGAGLTQEAGHLRGTVEYRVATAVWQHADQTSILSRGVATATLPSSENVYDLQMTMEATIPQTSTTVYAKYRVNNAFWGSEVDRLTPAGASTRFNVRVNQSLPFLRFSSADWQALVDIRNMFHEGDSMSLYDEALAIRAPKRIVGGLMVKF